MKTTLALLAAMSLSGALIGCSGSKSSAGPTSKATSKAALIGGGRPPDLDKDDNQPGIDSELGTVRIYGHEAGASERSMLSALVKRYFKAAATADGAAGCRLLDPGLAHAMPVDYGRLGPSYMQGPGKCPTILARLFRHDHAELAVKERRLKVVGVRTGGGLAFVLLHFSGLPEHQISVERKDGSWRIEMMLDDGIARIP